MLFRVEYLHRDFGRSTAQSMIMGSRATVIGAGVLTTDIVRAGLSYQLDEGGAA